MSKGKGRESSRISNNIYSRLSDPNDDESRFKVKLGKSRKKLRKIQRKEAKRLKHQKKLEWIQRRKNANNITNNSNKNGSKAVNNDIKAQNNGLKSIYKSESTKGLKSEKRVNFEKEREMRPTPDDIEIEYLERQLLKNKANTQDKNDAGKKRGRRVDVLQELKSEFLRDGFDEDFLDFLSNITTIADEENILDNDKLYPENNTLVKLRDDSLDELEDEDDEGDEMEEDELDELEEEDEVEESDDKDEEEQEEELESEQEQEEEVFDPSNVIKKQIGMVNRLSEGNYTVILNQLCEMYSKIISKGSENQIINECFDNLCDVVITMIINEVNVVISLVATQSALICSLTNYFNSTIIKRFVCKLFKKLESNLELMLKSESKKKLTVDENKLVVRNIIIAICSIYYYEVIDIDVIFHLIKLLTRRHLNEDVLQLLLILLKYSGQSINKNSEILGYLNDLVEKYKKEHEDFSNRVKFIEEELKSNKKSKNVLEQFDHLKNMIKSKVNMDRVTINLESIMNYNNIPDDVNGVLEFETKIVEKKNSKKDELIKKATKIGLNKDIQKTIFISIMDAISPENALDNILKIKLKTQQVF
ncbi:rna-binding protein, putative [Theileria annulata]|uniref:Rna-binding protein, putative n=1 Tax=Theileria annulata TaxID=5874 RepID=Q4UGW5_THEAN|nr:rna-binding protein, putative [Theileria annulata]CAI73674.1 rna-binding protein, putative [Theileria annulata]|eukprot:XP_954351.1 rna-binding protein, putative [Theileria annulata]